MRRNRALALTAIALTALSACGSPSPGGKTGGQVATLESAGATAGPTASATSERPRQRLDTTPEEFQAMLKPYNKCMTGRGVAPDAAKVAAGSGMSGPAAQKLTAQWEQANRVCEPQHYPLPAWERDPANPEARDFVVAVVACLKDKGVKHVAVAEDGLSVAYGGRQNDARSIREGLARTPDCEREVLARAKD